MDTKRIIDELIPAAKTLDDFEMLDTATDVKADILLEQTALLEQDMCQLLGDIATKNTHTTQ